MEIGAQNDIFAEPASAASERLCSSEKRRSADDEAEEEHTNIVEKPTAADISSHRRNSPSFRLVGKYSHR